jgi:hypothetical protein
MNRSKQLWQLFNRILKVPLLATTQQQLTEQGKTTWGFNWRQEAQQEADADISQLSNSMMSPTVDESPDFQPVEMPYPKPKRMRKRYVNRNGTWLGTKRLKKFYIAEPVYIKNAAGEFEQIRTVNKKGGLPAAYLED